MKKSNKEEMQGADKAKPLNNQNQSKTRKNIADETPKEKYPSGWKLAKALSKTKSFSKRSESSTKEKPEALR